MNNITIFRDKLHGYLYYKFKGVDYKVNVEQDNLFKIDQKDFDGVITNSIVGYSYTEIYTEDGKRTFVIIPSGGSRAAGGGRKGVNVLNQGTLLGLAQSINFTGDGVSTSMINGQATVNIPGGISSTGTVNYIPKFTPDGSSLGNSLLFDNGTSVLFGGTTAIASAAIALTSTTQGFLAPRMTTAQRNAIVAPATGLLIYNTSTSLFCYWDGATWQNIDSQAGGDVSGSGNTNYLTLWTDGPNSVIGDSVMSQDGTKIGINIFTPGATLDIIQTASNTGSPTALRVTTGAHTTLIAGTECIGVNFVLSATKQWSTGAIATQREILVQPPTYAFVGASTITTAATMAINGAPIAGANATITNPLAFWVQSGETRLVGTGTSSATYTLRTYNATPTEIFSVRADGHIGAGDGTTRSITVGFESKYNPALVRNTLFGCGISQFVVLSGADNTVMGGAAGNGLTSGNRNTIMGSLAGSVVSTGSNNVIIGYTAGQNAVDDLTAVGFNAGNVNTNPVVMVGSGAGQLSTGGGVTVVGYLAGAAWTNGADNTAMGHMAQRFTTTGDRNAAFGNIAGQYAMADASDNTYLGYGAGQLNNDTGSVIGTAGRNKNTFVGVFSGGANRGNNGIGLGYFAGFYETADNKLFIDSIDRTSEALARTNSLIYGTFDATVTNQRLVFNALVSINGRESQQQGADVASANDLTLGLDGNSFEITGATQINAITTANWQNGSVITLLFTSNPTVKHNTAGGAGTAVILLAGAADFGATAGDTLTLRLSEIGGTQAWREISRAVI